MRALGLDDNMMGLTSAIHWKCPRHVHQIVRGHCPGVKAETVLTSNNDIDEVIAHCVHYKACVIMLHVGPDPKLHEETNPDDLTTQMEKWRGRDRSASLWFFGPPLSILRI